MRAVLLYVVLVGLPVLGILGLLRVGQTLSAPISLAGTWNAKLDLPKRTDSQMEDPSIARAEAVLSIAQSGSRLSFTFDDRKTVLVGNIEDMRIEAASPDAPKSEHASSVATSVIYFRGRVNRQTAPDQLVGVLILDQGAVRTEVPLVAMRVSGPRMIRETH
jgi:hypothetical protein